MNNHHHKSHAHKPNHHTASPTKAAPAHAVAAQPGLTGDRLVVVLIMMAVAFFAAYNFAAGRNQANAAGIGAAGSDFYAQQGGSAGGGCCGGGGAPVEGTATIQDGVQRISVDTSAGSFNPNVIKVKAGVPLEIAFSQAPGGCLSGVLFPDFNINEDLTAGGKTVKLPALEKGTYTFYCQMQMVSAQIVAE